MMRRIVKYAAAVTLLATMAQAWAAEPIAGKWLLKSQQVSGRETASRSLTLRIAQSGDLLEFECSVAVDRKQEVSPRAWMAPQPTSRTPPGARSASPRSHAAAPQSTW
ncbi:MAG: hypothetical protein ACLQU1_21080 [Bryobacteraceae bacterium]